MWELSILCFFATFRFLYDDEKEKKLKMKQINLKEFSVKLEKDGRKEGYFKG